MAEPSVLRRLPALLLALGFASCASGGPQRVDCDRLPQDAFDRCRRMLALQWGTMEVVDPIGFRIETAWNPYVAGDRFGQKRAMVFLDDRGTVVVLAEVRWLEGGVITVPEFGEPHGDDELTGQLRTALAAALVRN